MQKIVEEKVQINVEDQDNVQIAVDGKENVEEELLNKLTINKDNESNITNTNSRIEEIFIKIQQNNILHNKLNIYLEALYLQFEIHYNEDIIIQIIDFINELNISDFSLEMTIDMLDNINEKITYIIEPLKIIETFNVYNDSFKNDIANFNNNTELIITLLSLFHKEDKYEGNYTIPEIYDRFAINLKLLNKLFYYPSLKKIPHLFFENQLINLYTMINENPNFVIEIIENLRLLILLIIKKYNNSKLFNII